MKEKKRKIQKGVANFFFVTAMLGIILWIGIEKEKDTKVKEVPYHTQDLATQMANLVPVPKVATAYDKVDFEKEYKGFQVLAKLEIPNIELETYVLKQYSKNALNISVTKFWGADPNQIGNCCIAGHNFQNKNMFHNLRNLKKGEHFFLSDYEVGKVEYEIYDIYIVEPENVECLSQETKGRREVTLITCTSDSKKRIIVKAREGE